MGQMNFGVCVSHRKICQRNMKVNPRGKYNTLHDETFSGYFQGIICSCKRRKRDNTTVFAP